MFLIACDWKKAEHYALKSKDFNQQNLKADQVLMIAYRKMGQMNKAKAVIDSLLDDLPLYHLARFEDLLLGTFNEANKK